MIESSVDVGVVDGAPRLGDEALFGSEGTVVGCRRNGRGGEGLEEDG